MRALLDACVLYPTLLRSILLEVARAEAFTPLWSARIVEEWRRAALRSHPDQAEVLAGEIALARSAWPLAEITVPEGSEDGLSLPDENDRHVLAAAMAGQADLIVTLNLRDFPARTLARNGLRAAHPDPFLLDLCAEKAELARVVLGPVDAARAQLRPPQTRRELLKKSRLPRLAKALESAV